MLICIAGGRVEPLRLEPQKKITKKKGIVVALFNNNSRLRKAKAFHALSITSHLVVNIIDSSICLIIGRRPGTLDPPNPCGDVPRATPGCSKDPFFMIFNRFLADQKKNEVIWHRTKTSKIKG